MERQAPRLCALLFNLDDYEDGCSLGSGRFADALQTTHKVTHTRYAKKMMKDFRTAHSQRTFFRELEVLRRCNHPGVLALRGFAFDVITDEENREKIMPVFLSDVYENGNLLVILHRARKGWNATTRSKAIFGIAAAMKYLHRRDIIHRDLKPDNILLNSLFEPVIADFGSSKIQDTSTATRGLGSLLFTAPEAQIAGTVFEPGSTTDEASKKCDVFSYGVILHQMFTSKLDIDDHKEIGERLDGVLERLKNGARLERTEGRFSDPMWGLIERCWHKDPNARPSFAQIVDELRSDHNWVVRGTDLGLLRQYEEAVSEFQLLDISKLPNFSPLCRSVQEFENPEPINGRERVKKVVHRDRRTNFVMKELSKTVTGVPFDNQALFFRELEASACFRDEGKPVIPLVGFAMSLQGTITIMTPYMENGSLLGLFKQKPEAFNATKKSGAIFGLAAGVEIGRAHV
jgi:serine/threonine protein kinase